MLCNESVDQSTGDMPRREWISFADFRLEVREGITKDARDMEDGDALSIQEEK